MIKGWGCSRNFPDFPLLGKCGEIHGNFGKFEKESVDYMI